MDRDIFRSVVRRDFAAFNQKAFEVLNPATPFEDNWHLHVIAKALTDMAEGSTPRLIINMPPRSLKSSTISVAWPAFLLGHNPATRVVVTSYSEALSEALSNDTRRLMESEFYQGLFPGTRLKTNSSQLLLTTAGGRRRATSVGGSITGLGGEWIIIDDPHNAAEAHSAAARDTVKRYWDEVLSTRYDHAPTGKTLVVMQRLHTDDLTGHLLAQTDCDVLSLPAKATEDILIDSDVGGPHLYSKGTLLHRSRLPQGILDQARRRMGSVNFEAQYQQRPVPASGNIIKREWIRYSDEPPSRDGAQVTLSLDTATKTESAHDYSAATIWLTRPDSHHLIHVWRDKVAFPDLKRKVRELCETFSVQNLLIEDQGSGTSLIQEIKSVGIAAIGRKTRDPKDVRLSAASSFLEAGLVFLPQNAYWLAEFLRELLGFPGEAHDDQVDSLSQYFGWVRDRPKPMFDYEFM